MITVGLLPWATVQESRERIRPGENASHLPAVYNLTMDLQALSGEPIALDNLLI